MSSLNTTLIILFLFESHSYYKFCLDSGSALHSILHNLQREHYFLTINDHGVVARGLKEIHGVALGASNSGWKALVHLDVKAVAPLRIDSFSQTLCQESTSFDSENTWHNKIPTITLNSHNIGQRYPEYCLRTRDRGTDSLPQPLPLYHHQNIVILEIGLTNKYMLLYS